MGTSGNQLFEGAVCSGVPRFSHHGMRSYLCGLGTKHSYGGQRSRRDMGYGGIYGASLFLSV